MITRCCAALVASIGLLVPVAGSAEEVVFSYRGSESRSTAEFEVRAPWILDWRVTTEGAYESAVEVSLLQAGTSVHEGRVLMTKYPGNGVRLFDKSGTFFFRVDSSFANYSLTVKELTEDEAAAYTPRERSSLLDR